MAEEVFMVDFLVLKSRIAHLNGHSGLSRPRWYFRSVNSVLSQDARGGNLGFRYFRGRISYHIYESLK
jgi:hypothetical protein